MIYQGGVCNAPRPALFVKYSYNALDLVSHINYNGAKEVSYQYNAVGELVKMDDWLGTTTGMDWQNVATYVYDETNRMVEGKNEQGEYSLYTYNGLGVRVARELIMLDNTHGYTDFHKETPSVDAGITKAEVAKESYVIDYTSATFNALTMDEVGGFNYRYVYGLDKLSVKITSEGTNWWGQHVTDDILKDYYHQDRMGSTTNLTDKFGRVVGRADYNEWGQITYKDALDITSSYRRIYPQLNYTGHDWDDVLGMYYAKARFYSADDKRFVAMDPIKGQITDPLSMVSYLYCVDNPLRWVDPLGLMLSDINISQIALDGNGGDSSIEYVIGKMKELEELAGIYYLTRNKKEQSIATLNFIRQFTYNAAANPMWPSVDGPVDENFINYVKETNSSLYSYFENLTCATGVSSDVTLDIRHFAATLVAQYYSTNNLIGSNDLKYSFAALGIGEEKVDILAGWGGDLQTLIAKDIILKDKYTDSDYETIYNRAKEYMSNSDKNVPSHFSKEDFVADVDAVYFRDKINKDKSITELMEDYYLSGVKDGAKKRFTHFRNSLFRDFFKQTRTDLPEIDPDMVISTSTGSTIAKGSVYVYSQLRWFVVRWPLYKSNGIDHIPKPVYTGAADAFVDLIWEWAAEEAT